MQRSDFNKTSVTLGAGLIASALADVCRRLTWKRVRRLRFVEA